MNKRNWIWIVAVIGLLFYLPYTRQIMLFILPLGRGLDDLIAWGCIITLVIYGIAKGWIKFEKRKTFRQIDRHRNTRIKQAVWGVAIFLVGLFLTPDLNDSLSYGNPLSAESWYILVAAGILIVVGWQAISYFDKRRIAK